VTVTALHRTFEQELLAVLRGASLECPLCGEFVLHRADATIGCPQCGLELGPKEAVPVQAVPVQAVPAQAVAVGAPARPQAAGP
jgi:uncharacterized protein (DUF983 family)